MNGGLLAVRNGMSGDVNAMQTEIRHLASDLQDRLNRLNSISRKGAAHASEGVQDFIADTLDSLDQQGGIATHRAACRSGSAISPTRRPA